ncbi:uncharacterized protein [Palaemon carinicauda]|uniref:uncharacterized protein n=1 Tax=Palaemon carinicauda TaxID=392227 RepID=UPI0035B62A60
MRTIQCDGLKERYENDADFALSLRMLPAIAFVPTERVVSTFEELCDSDIFPPEVQEVLDYFEDTWIGRPDRRQRRRPPQFPHEMWNVYEAVLHNLPKTNNSVEGWHRAFEEQMTACHPNIWKFIDCIKKEQALNQVRFEQYVAGQEPPKKKKKYRDCAQRLRRLVGNYDPDVNVIDYLRGIAHNISY